jgi:hypothetical protein
MRRVLLATLAALTATACLGVWVSGALAGNGATVVREKGLTVSFNGGISPRKLPRDGKAPVGVQMGGKIKSVDHEPPILKKIILDINREGVIQTRGLQLCPLGRLKNASQAGARR